MEALCQVATTDATKQFAARTELWPIQTLTLSDQQFLTGDNNGKPTAIAGQLRIAQGSGCLPVVVLQHSSGGFLANIEFWSRELNAAGISTFALDGFTGRGLTEATRPCSVASILFSTSIARSTFSPCIRASIHGALP
jgi:hypothetical protein